MRRRAWAHSPRAANHPKIVTIRALFRDPMHASGGVHAEAGLKFQIANVSLLCFTFTGRIVIAASANTVDLTNFVLDKQQLRGPI